MTSDNDSNFVEKIRTVVEVIQEIRDVSVDDWSCDHCGNNMIDPRNSNLLIVYPGATAWSMIKITGASTLELAQILRAGSEAEVVDALDDADKALDYVRIYEEETREDEGGQMFCKECIDEVDVEDLLRSSLSTDDMEESQKLE